MYKNIQQLIHTNMTRKEFLATLGMGAVTVFGFANVIKFFSQSPTVPPHATGYGASPYGK